MIAVLDYKAGNLRSVERALNSLGIENVVTDDYKVVEKANRIIFPGVGSAYSAMENLKTLHLDQSLLSAYKKGIPILGICLGTQIILSHSEEGDVDCLGLIPGDVIAFKMTDLKIPHMGWNSVNLIQNHPIFEGVNNGEYYYFVHSYYPKPRQDNHCLGITEYGVNFTCVLGNENLIALQFHPEKSGPPGLKILENFSKWNGY